MHRMAILQISTRQQSVEEFCKRLDQKSPFRLDQRSPKEFCLRPQLWTTRFQQEDLADGSRRSVQCFIGTNQHTVVHVFAHHDTRGL